MFQISFLNEIWFFECLKRKIISAACHETKICEIFCSVQNVNLISMLNYMSINLSARRLLTKYPERTC